MELPSTLLRMLEGSCVNDNLKNWSIYEEKDGSYVFKIRFIPNCDRHIEDNHRPVPISNSSVKCSFKRKNQKQVDRDYVRNQAYQDRRITRSQAAKSSAETNKQSSDPAIVCTPALNPESPIETVRHSSFDLNAEVPEFIPNVDFESTARETLPMTSYESYLDEQSSSDDEKEIISYVCHYCRAIIKEKLYRCGRCNINACESCINKDLHKFHQRSVRMIQLDPS